MPRFCSVFPETNNYSFLAKRVPLLVSSKTCHEADIYFRKEMEGKSF